MDKKWVWLVQGLPSRGSRIDRGFMKQKIIYIVSVLTILFSPSATLADGAGRVSCFDEYNFHFQDRCQAYSPSLSDLLNAPKPRAIIVGQMKIRALCHDQVDWDQSVSAILEREGFYCDERGVSRGSQTAVYKAVCSVTNECFSGNGLTPGCITKDDYCRNKINKVFFTIEGDGVADGENYGWNREACLNKMPSDLARLKQISEREAVADAKEEATFGCKSVFGEKTKYVQDSYVVDHTHFHGCSGNGLTAYSTHHTQVMTLGYCQLDCGLSED